MGRDRKAASQYTGRRCTQSGVRTTLSSVDDNLIGQLELSRSPLIRTIPFDKEAIDRIADCLGVSATVAPFRLPSSTVWQLTVPGERDRSRPVVLMTLWPGIHRVDVIAGPSTTVFTDVQTVDLVPGVEIQFRRGNRDLLIVAAVGKVIVRA